MSFDTIYITKHTIQMNQKQMLILVRINIPVEAVDLTIFDVNEEDVALLLS